MAQDAVIRNIEIICEAANNITKSAPAFAAEYDDIPWPVIYAMRNRISHAYHQVDLEIVWQTIHRDLPGLHERVIALIRELE